ncbi:hypothetical protein EV424DRAFT_1318508, partial [Suillus variegatus]
MTECWLLAPILLCPTCRACLLCKPARQPVNSLANFQYYGHERLPDAVRDALRIASPYDLMLISCARASHVSHFYSYKSNSGGYRQSEESSQHYNQGNVAIRPQDSPQLRSLLPPTYDEIRDAVCVVFAGQNQVPTRDTVRTMQAVLVMKSIVQTLIEFLIAHNPWYQQSGVSFSESNMADLFDPVDAADDSGILRALEICHLSGAGPPDPSESHVSHNVIPPDSAVDGDIVVEAVGYTKSDHSVGSKQGMKLNALAYILDRNCFVVSRTGSRFIGDSDPGLLSFLFPHLDPWGIGGFYHVAR